MSITYNWIFDPLTVKRVEGSLTDVVIRIDWRRIAIDGQYAANVYGQIALGPPDSANYTEFTDLTKAQVESWVVAELTQDRVSALDAALAENIANTKNPPIVPLAPPW